MYLYKEYNICIIIDKLFNRNKKEIYFFLKKYIDFNYYIIIKLREICIYNKIIIKSYYSIYNVCIIYLNRSIKNYYCSTT
ncbi:hypothetical protein PFBG_03634 [Plasmodium falciparum 7G8]|uniref:Uncharacterized protein n=1 Tax=Plasmodium falciparum (isolate 7G8) TaxID=57266 RepID=W7FJK6_PLAF8|nr:hypothetical protein PFBG_03634 [Plasmodium falciparum 7G8]